MSFRQWLSHLRSWWHGVRRFPFPWSDWAHLWTSLLGERKETCFTCGAERLDPYWAEEDGEWQRRVSATWDEVTDRLAQ